MIVNMSNNATPDQINHIIDRIKECGFQAHVVQGAERTIIGAIGSSGRRSEIEALRAAPGVAEVIQISHPFKLVSRQLRQTRTVVDVRGTKIGDGDTIVIAGPCSVESEEQLMETARSVKASGANMLMISTLTLRACDSGASCATGCVDAPTPAASSAPAAIARSNRLLRRAAIGSGGTASTLSDRTLMVLLGFGGRGTTGTTGEQQARPMQFACQAASTRSV